MSASTVLKPLIDRKIFETEESAVRELLRGHILRQIEDLQAQIEDFEQKYGMSFDEFDAYLRERSRRLQSTDLSADQRKRLNQSIMQEEDDWFEWKVAREMLESWLGLQQEVSG